MSNMSKPEYVNYFEVSIQDMTGETIISCKNNWNTYNAITKESTPEATWSAANQQRIRTLEDLYNVIGTLINNFKTNSNNINNIKIDITNGENNG